MRTRIDPDALYWASFNRFELRLPGQCVIDCSQPGPADDAVAYWAPKVLELVQSDAFPRGPDADSIREELQEYGAWDADELAGNETNWHRLVWIAAGNIAEDDQPDCSEPLKEQTA